VLSCDDGGYLGQRRRRKTMFTGYWGGEVRMKDGGTLGPERANQQWQPHDVTHALHARNRAQPDIKILCLGEEWPDAGFSVMKKYRPPIAAIESCQTVQYRLLGATEGATIGKINDRPGHEFRRRLQLTASGFVSIEFDVRQN
jgi:hypothetical protein